MVPFRWGKEKNGSKARRGDIVIYNWTAYQDEDGYWHAVGPTDHVGIIISKKKRQTIEGNRGTFEALSKIRVGTNTVHDWQNHVFGFVHPSH